MPKIFISYRREDSQHQADRLHGALKKHVANPKRDIFIDVDNIPVGVDFVQHLDAKVAECDVLLALIGPGWLKAGDGILGGRRLDDPKDFVRIEIASALRRGIPVAPILLDGALMPKEGDLPGDLKALARRNAAEIRRVTFENDAERMIRGLNLKQIGAKAAPPVPRSSRRQPASGGNSIALVVALAVVSGGAWVWFTDPLGWKTARIAEAVPNLVSAANVGEAPATSMEGVAQVPSSPTSAGSSPASAGEAPRSDGESESRTPAPAASPAAAAPSISVDVAKAEFEKARANFADAETKQKRAQDLWNRGLTSQAELAQANADVRAAKSALIAREQDYQRAAAAMPPAPRAIEGFRDCPDCPEMVKIPAGSFMMGSPASEISRSTDEGPQRRVTVPAFAAGKYEVTIAEWRRCGADGGCRSTGLQGEGGDQQPARMTSWNDAHDYVAWLSRKTGRTYRLLSEAEWEYAARAGTTTPYAFGKSLSASQANFGSPENDTAPVGKYPANAFGLHDMHGNVWEWVEDCYADSYSAGQPGDGSAYTGGTCYNRVNRGGSYAHGGALLRSAVRSRGQTRPLDHFIGFRVARTLP